MRLVIIGASGNVGTALLRRLAADRLHTVVAISRRMPPPVEPYGYPSWESLDIADPASADKLALIFDGVDAVVNLAWGFQPGRDVDYLESVGVGGLRHILHAVAAAKVPHLVHMSSVGAYSAGSYGRPVDESWPTTGIPSSPYSRQKAAAERILDEHQALLPDLVISRPRPGLVMNRDAGSSLLRYALPAIIPARAVGWLPVLPLDRQFAVPIVHADDVANALATILEQRAGGPFNLSGATPLSREIVGRALHAKPIHLPRSALGALVTGAYRLHLQRLDPGWIDLAFSTPLLSTRRAFDVLGWVPKYDALAAVEELIEGMKSAASTESPVLRRRSILAELGDLRRGPATKRRLT